MAAEVVQQLSEMFTGTGHLVFNMTVEEHAAFV